MSEPEHVHLTFTCEPCAACLARNEDSRRKDDRIVELTHSRDALALSIEGAAQKIAAMREELVALKDERWKVEGEEHQTPCTYGSLCPWCEIAGLRRQLSVFVAAAMPKEGE